MSFIKKYCLLSQVKMMKITSSFKYILKNDTTEKQILQLYPQTGDHLASFSYIP
jgi:hypothetical protein